MQPSATRRGLPEIFVFPTDEEASRGEAVVLAARARRAIAERDRFTAVLSGGETPRRMLELLADPSAVGDVPWDRTHLFWGDERGVPPDHPRSNYRMVREALLDRVDIPPANVHRIRGELPAIEAARRYDREIHEVLGEGEVFDFVHLGVGTDGHTASLFPHDAALRERTRSVVATVDESSGGEPRITFTLPLLAAARCVELLALEAEKAPVLRRVLEGDEVDELPLRGITPAGEYIWLLSNAAARSLRSRT